MTTATLGSIQEKLQSFTYKCVQHDLEHIKNVTHNALKITNFVDPKQEIIDRNLLQAITTLHDITYTMYKSSLKTYLFEGRLAYQLLKSFCTDIPLQGADRETLLDAVKRHPHSFPFRRLNKGASLYAQILQDADTLEFFRQERIEAFIQRYFPRSLTPWICSQLQNRQNSLQFFLNLEASKTYLKSITSTKMTTHPTYKMWNTTGTKTLLCIHGYADTADLFKKLKPLLGTEWKIVAVNLPTVTTRGKIFKIDELADYVEQVCGDSHINPSIVLGFSMGGLVALEYCYRKKTPLLMANSFPYLLYNRVHIAKIWPLAKTMLSLGISTYIIGIARLILDTLQKTLNKNSRELIKVNPKGIYGTVINALGYNGLEKYKNLHLPKTIILFEDDTVLNFNYFKDLGSIPEFKIKRVEVGGHASKSVYWKNLGKELNKFVIEQCNY